MKKLSKFCIYIFFIMLFAADVRCEEIQLTDYMYTAHRDMLDGYSYVEFAGGNNIIKPDGTYLYDSTEYSVYYPGTYTYNKLNSFDQVFAYPQLKCGNKFRVYSRQNYKEGIMNDKGELEIPCSHVEIYDMGEYYYGFDGDEAYLCGVINAKTGEDILGGLYQLYISMDKEKIACVKYKNKSEEIVDIYFYDKGKLYDSSENIAEPENSIISDIYGENLYLCYLYNECFKEKDPETGEIREKWYYNFLDVKKEQISVGDDPGKYILTGLGSDRVDRTYYFKGKEINGVTHYALYTDVPDSQRDKYRPVIPETVPENYKENIQKAYDEGLLKNNFMCFYNSGITGGEMAFLLSQMYGRLKLNPSIVSDADLDTKLSVIQKACYIFLDDLYYWFKGINSLKNTQVYDAYRKSDEYRKGLLKAPNEDVKDIYCLFAYRYGIINSDLAFSHPDKAMTEQEVYECLDNFANKFGVSLNRQNESSQICTKAQAYSEIYELYSICKKSYAAIPAEIYAVLILGALFLVIMYFKFSRSQ